MKFRSAPQVIYERHQDILFTRANKREEAMMRNKIFGRLLKAGIGSIATCEGKTNPAIEDELGAQIGISAASIQRYKAGHIPPDPRTVQILAEAGVKRGYLNREWLQSFCHAASYPSPEKLLDELYPIGPTRPRPTRIYHNLPAPSYSRFVMREQAYADVIDGLQQRSAVVLLASLGGMGKTSLAREIAAHSLQAYSTAAHFDAVVWVGDREHPGTTTLSIVLDKIARTLDYPGFIQFEHEEKRREVEQLLRRQKVLLVVDNFETITDGALLPWLLRLPEPSKTIVTSREYSRGFRNNTCVIDLHGMTETEAQEFIDQRLRFLKIEKLVHDRTQLEPLVVATGGNPKAIELALGLVKHEHRPLPHVIEDLYAARGELFDDLFTRAWALLDEAARLVLLSMPLFPDSACGEALSATADVHGFAFDRAIERLTDLALLDVHQADLSSMPRYALHPLVQAFARAKVHEMSEFEVRARIRCSAYFIDFATRHIVRDKPKERYWNSLAGREPRLIDAEWSNFLNVLAWADQHGEDQTLVDLMVLLVHYIDRHALNRLRLWYASKAAEAAHRLEQQTDEAWLRIDALGWTLIEESRFADAEQEIMRGLQIAQTLEAKRVEANDIMALAYAFLAKVYLCQEALLKASEFIDRAMPVHCQSVVRYRVNMVAGELAHKQHRYQEAITLYQEAHRLAEQYSGEVQGADELRFRLGFTYLAQGELVRAETAFREVSSLIYQVDTLEAIYGQYGLACVARTKGEIGNARQLAQEALDTISRFRVGHRLRKEIKDFLVSLETSTT